MEPIKSTASSSKSKRARVDDSTPDPTNSAIPHYPERLSAAAWKWISDREHLKLIIEKSFDSLVMEHLGLATLFGVKGVRMVLDKECLSSIIGIPDAENTITVNSNKKTIDESPDWNYETTCNLLKIRPHPDKDQKILPFSIVSLIIHTMCNTGYDTTCTYVFHYPLILSRIFAVNKVWIPPAKKDRLRECIYAGFRLINKTIRTGIGACQ
ncbi:hypothetical protein M9H77_17827 [Catharanthus roseus]|uniref:Uncharacterized protein n=1 Tax=Catharanthus roseus TaxID=4058 RepID=A0ACC0B5S1_CATRO|nr:hypothetical protein M9H77_17827 [Catharanthus roseus]